LPGRAIIAGTGVLPGLLLDAGAAHVVTFAGVCVAAEGAARIEAICFRSVTEYVETLLRTAAKAGPARFHDPD